MAERCSSYVTWAALEAMLAAGWKIEPPVYARPHWQSALSAKPTNTYHFILCRGSQVNLVSIPESPEIEHLMTECKLTVDCL